MLDKLIVTDVPPYSGEYPLDVGELIDSLTLQEYHVIKQVAGVRAGELFEALDAGDTDIVVAFAKIILERSGKRNVDPQAFWAAKADCVTLQIGDRPDEPEADEVPPTAPELTV